MLANVLQSSSARESPGEGSIAMHRQNALRVNS